MNLSDKELDKKIQEYLSKKEMVLPESYTKMVKSQLSRCCEKSEKKDDRKKFFKKETITWKQVAAIFVVICTVMGGSIGAHAAINYIQERMNNLSQEEKDTLAEQAILSDTDSFSREFTEEESERLELLSMKYMQEGLYPEDDLLQISNENELVADRICFVADTSTFYLPEGAIDDEQLLELIDFYHKRDYSVTSQDVTKEYQKIDEISHKDAQEQAASTLERVFKIHTDSMKIETEYDQATDFNGDTFSMDYINFIDKIDRKQYTVTVDLQTGYIRDISFVKSDESNYSKTQKEAPELYQELFTDAEKMAFDYLKEGSAWSKNQIEYIANEDGILDTGIVNYVFQNERKEYCIVSYSCSQECFYQIRYFTNEEKEARDLQIQEQIEMRHLKKVVVDMK